MIDVRRGADRFTTATDGVVARHAFSYGAHYDPANVGFGALVAHNDESLAPEHGYDDHAHNGVEIVTWVLDGAVRHEDTLTGVAVLRPGTVQRLSAGRGVRHSEHGGPGEAVPTRFVQMWLRADDSEVLPSMARAEVAAGSGLVVLASGDPAVDAPVRVATAGATLQLAALADAQRVRLPDSPRLHVYVARGNVELAGAGALGEGDAARVADEHDVVLTGHGPAEVLVWQLP